jgi:hypothetical protein
MDRAIFERAAFQLVDQHAGRALEHHVRGLVHGGQAGPDVF